MYLRFFLILMSLLLFSCSEKAEKGESINSEIETLPKGPSLIVLGTVQDAGSPHMGCKKDCCKELFEHPDPSRQVVSLGLSDGKGNKYLFEASPDISRQMKKLKAFGVDSEEEAPQGIFLTHAHIGHYTGLMYLGKEAMNANKVPIYTMPRMQEFLTQNEPWGQLLSNNNISFVPLENEKQVNLNGDVTVTPILVPHRDEYSETVGYRIEGPNKSALFIPDIDKWEKWDKDITEEISKVDYAFLDATFYSGAEINNRDISLIPHPFIIESFEKFEALAPEEKAKIHFIHFNHTNPVLSPDSEESSLVEEKGFKAARIDEVFSL